MVKKDKIELVKQIYFATGEVTIGQDSFALLKEVADVLQSHPTMKLHIEVHTDASGTKNRNLQLSRARAKSVRQHLIAVHHISPNRLTSHGFGAERLIDKENPESDKNRRTEFVIVEQ